MDDFITDLHCLADRCSYGDLSNEMIWDRTVVGLLNDTLSEKLQLDSKLTLEIAVTTARQIEEVHKQQPVVRGKPSDHNTELVDTVHSRKGVNRQKSEHKSQNKAGTGNLLEHQQSSCTTKLNVAQDMERLPPMADSNALQGKPFVTVARKRAIFKSCAELNPSKSSWLLLQSLFLEWLLIPLAA